VGRFYDTAAAPFEERKRKIEAEEDPYVPPYSEDDEPAFQSEWSEANECLEVLGYSCVSMLSASLQLYLMTFDSELDLNCGGVYKSEFKKGGWINGYRVCFRERLGIRWEDSPSDLQLLEAITLARNRIQHPRSIVMNSVKHSQADAKKQTTMFFVNDNEMQVFASMGMINSDWLMPTLTVSREKLQAAVGEVETFCEWLDGQIRQKRASG
jgi:hypothetical protein